MILSRSEKIELTTCLRIVPYCENSCSINDVAAGGKLQHTAALFIEIMTALNSMF